MFGGQGTPLAPIGDRILFSKYDYCMNIGGLKLGNEVNVLSTVTKSKSDHSSGKIYFQNKFPNK